MALPNQQAVDVANLLHCGLLQIDYDRQFYAPSLAESLPTVQLIGDSLTRLSYRLRAAAAWDDGHPVLAHDVAFTLKLMYFPGLPNEGTRAQYSFIRALRYDTNDARSFTLECRGQSPGFALSSGDFPILSEAAFDPQHQLRRISLAQLQDWPTTAPLDSSLATLAKRYLALTAGSRAGYLASCGPYQLTAWKKDRYLSFRRKAHWWADRLPNPPFVLRAQPRQLQFVIIPDAVTASLALQRGEVDLYPQMPAPEFDRLRHSSTTRAALNFYQATSYDIMYAGFNMRRPALADALTRQALSHLFDAAGLLRATQLGQGQRTVGLIHPSNRADYNDSLALVPYAPAKAAALLRQAGWQRGAGTDGGWQRRGSNGTTQFLHLQLRYRTGESAFEVIAFQFRAAAAQLGIPVVLQPTEAAVYTSSLQAGDFDVYVRVLKGNPFVFNFAPILHSRAIGAGNFPGFGTLASDRLIEAVAAADSPAHRARLLRRFQAMMQAEAPLVPLFFLANCIAARRELTGLHVTGIKPGYAISALERVEQPVPTP
ncbi:hypothetical protein IC235_04315 [Hymenobacter sp. BT664]|uniref:Solute-binding protein family 5 domain-containing protein n=1 Tax=Hymenobacter montanus TaxID=2771359 RepID=A0A927BBH6_9BACT|nr:hypothetical protein [Hymenobacter montanus]